MVLQDVMVQFFNKLFYKQIINGLKKGFLNWILNMPNVRFTVYIICFVYIVYICTTGYPVAV